MNLPIPKDTSNFIARRIDENRIVELDILLGNLVTDRTHELDASHLIRSVQAALTTRQGFINIESEEHKKLQRYVNDLEKIIAAHKGN